MFPSVRQRIQESHSPGMCTGKFVNHLLIYDIYGISLCTNSRSKATMRSWPVFDIRAMRCEIDIKKFAYASAEGGRAPIAPVPRSATANHISYRIVS